MLFSDAKPFIRCAVHRKLSRYNNLKLTVKDSRLFYIISGSGKIIINDVPYDLSADTIILFREATQYKWEAANNTEYLSLNFDYENNYSHITQKFQPLLYTSSEEKMFFKCDRIEDFSLLNEPIVIYNAMSLKSSVENIITEYEITDNYSCQLLPLLIKELIFNILRFEENNFSQNLNNRNSIIVVKKVIKYIYINFSQKLTNQEIAHTFNFSPSHLGRIFKKHTGYSIHDFILQHRIQTAKEFLSDTDLNLGEICEKIGYNDIYHFSKIFKQKTGLTPSKYRLLYATAKRQL